MIDKVAKNIPQPSDAAIKKLIRENIPANTLSTIDDFRRTGYEPPAWLVRVVTIAYQSGRYDEASAETFAGSF